MDPPKDAKQDMTTEERDERTIFILHVSFSHLVRVGHVGVE